MCVKKLDEQEQDISKMFISENILLCFLTHFFISLQKDLN